MSEHHPHHHTFLLRQSFLVPQRLKNFGPNIGALLVDDCLQFQCKFLQQVETGMGCSTFEKLGEVLVSIEQGEEVFDDIGRNVSVLFLFFPLEIIFSQLSHNRLTRLRLNFQRALKRRPLPLGPFPSRRTDFDWDSTATVGFYNERSMVQFSFCRMAWDCIGSGGGKRGGGGVGCRQYKGKRLQKKPEFHILYYRINIKEISGPQLLYFQREAGLDNTVKTCTTTHLSYYWLNLSLCSLLYLFTKKIVDKRSVSICLMHAESYCGRPNLFGVNQRHIQQNWPSRILF